MKILHIKAENDYDASTFEEMYGGQNVDDIILKVENGEKLVGIEGEELVSEVIEFNEVDIMFINFVKSEVLDYDDSKHSNIYASGSVVS